MRSRRIIIGVGGMLAIASSVAIAQAVPPVAGPRLLHTTLTTVSASAVPAVDIVREIDDPNSGDRWLLVHDSNHPAGPGILLEMSAVRVEPNQAGPAVSTAAPIIHGGDRVIVEEDTAVVETRLEAVAMGPAQAGSPFNLRLSIGGRIVRAFAVAPGRAVIHEEAGR